MSTEFAPVGFLFHRGTLALAPAVWGTAAVLSAPHWLYAFIWFRPKAFMQLNAALPAVPHPPVGLSPNPALGGGGGGLQRGWYVPDTTYLSHVWGVGASDQKIPEDCTIGLRHESHPHARCFARLVSPRFWADCTCRAPF